MIPLFATQQVREVDEYAVNQLDMPSIILMENAAIEIFNISVNEFQYSKRDIVTVGFICGKGNNGGDGFAAARHFVNNGFNVNVLYTGEENEMSVDAKTNFIILRRLAENNPAVKIRKYDNGRDISFLSSCDVIFDALLGSGAKGELKEPYNVIIDKLNSIDAFKIAIDIPTGLDADKGSGTTIFKADLTITLGEFKKGLFIQEGNFNCGKIVKGNIGVNSSFFDNFDVDSFLIEPEDIYEFLPRKKKNIHKYSAGKVFVIAGSGKLPGAAALTSKAALRTGAGSSILAFPGSVKKLIHKNLHEVIVEPYDDKSKEYLLPENVKGFSKRIKWSDVLVIGPGLGRESETQAAVLQVLQNHDYKNIVIDADAMFALSEGKYKEIDIEGAVLTPHHGEFSNLLGLSTEELERDLFNAGKTFVEETGALLVLKGAPTIIFNPGETVEVFVNTTGNAGMAKFGTGDVLTGVIAGFLSQSQKTEEAVLCAVYLHSLTADLLLPEFTEYGYTASDIIKKLPSSINFIRKSFD